MGSFPYDWYPLGNVGNDSTISPPRLFGGGLQRGTGRATESFFYRGF